MNPPFILLSEGLDGQPGGIQRVSRQVATALVHSKDPAFIWSANDRLAQRLPSPLEGRGFGKNYPAMFFAACTTQKLPSKGCPVSCWHMGLLPVAAALAARLGSRADLFLHGIEAWGEISWMRSLAMRRIRRIGANSHFTLERFRQKHPQYALLPGVVLPLGLSPEFVQASENAKSKAGFSYILTVTRQSEHYKGVTTLLDAFKKIREKHPALKLVFVGEGALLGEHRVRAAEMGLADAVVFAGNVTDRELAEWYAGCEFFVLLSKGEGFGIVFLEAMYHGKPVVATRADAAGEVIADGATGMLVTPQDREAAAEAILRLLAGKDEARAMGERGRRRVLAQFMPQHFEARLKKYWNE